MASINSDLRSSTASHIGDQFNGGTLEVRDGTSVLASFTLQDPAFSETDGEISLTGLPMTEEASSSGTADNVRIESAGGTYAIEDLSVGTDASANHVQIDNTSVSSGQDLTLQSYSFTVPSAIKDPS